MGSSSINRREFIKLVLAAGAGLGLSRIIPGKATWDEEQIDSTVFLPLVMNGSGDLLSGRVIHIHAPQATNWDFNSSTYYGRTQATGVLGVSQPVVDAMVDRGLTELLGLTPSQVVEAWQFLLPDYAPGKQVAIKMNFNNSSVSTCNSTTSAIDAIAQPLNSLVRGLKLRGVREQDIIAYDTSRSFSNRVYNELRYPGIQVHDASGCHGHASTWSSNDSNAMVHFAPPSGSSPSVRLCDTLIQADYVINMPIIKPHPLAGVTLGFKNHFGSTNNPSGMHGYVDTSYAKIQEYNALVDLYRNPHILEKTILTMADGIYGSRLYHNSPPGPWTSFNNQSPCSLFFAVDPVAIDSVMLDILRAEPGNSIPSTSDAYLKLAANADLGIYESGNPWLQPYGSGYSRIVYRRIEL